MHRISSQEDLNSGLIKLLEIDPRLTDIASKATPLPLRLEEPGFGGLARIIIGQQVSRASAEAIHGRFQKHIDPQTPLAFLEAGETAWIEIGLSRAKQRTLAGLCEAIVAGDFDLDRLTRQPAEAAISEMIRVKGIGPWTAEVYLLFCAGHPDIFPAGDLALQEGVRHAFNLAERPVEKQTRLIAERWKPLRGIASRLFWSYYKVIKEGRSALPL